MQDRMKEHISAFIDGEANDLERERALRALAEDAALRGSWERYHLTRTVIRRELDVVVPASMSERIRQAIEHEDMTTGRRFISKSMAFKALAGGAIAATVATVAILQFPSDRSPEQFAKTPTRTVATRGLPAEVQPMLPEQQRALNPYLVQHAEFAQATGMNSLSGYARVVGRGDSGTE
jgi:sigma-E factor negative regulatory protein RseA